MNRRLFLSGLVLGTGAVLGAISGYRFDVRQPALALGLASRPETTPEPTPEPIPPAPMALVFHPSFLIYTGPSVGSVAEGPARLEAIVNRIRATADLAALPMYLPYPATGAQLGRAHGQDYIRYIQSQAVLAQNERAFLKTFDPQTKKSETKLLPAAATPPSLIRPYQAASLSAGGAVMAVDLVMREQAKQAFALLRPPGHHAHTAGYRGFCVFNNAAVAARHAQEVYGIKRVLIVDWDVHHGNGTQQIFETDPDVLFVSVHQAGIYPRSGRLDEHGRGPGLGKTINLPLPGGMGDRMYDALFTSLLAPVARAFQPELIIVSAGQDAHAGERLAQMRLSDHGYARLARIVQELAGELCSGKLVLLLEGGYNPETTASSVCAILQELTGGPPLAGKAPEDRTPPEAIQRQLQQILKAQRSFWPQLARSGERG